MPSDAAASEQPPPQAGRGAKNLIGGRRPLPAHVSVYLFVIVPFLALVAAVPFAWGWGLTWVDVALTAGWYVFTCLGATVGYHRYFTHGSFKTRRGTRIALALAGSMAVQGPILHWVADHRRHHAYSDREGDPHSPWLFGTSPVALVRGFWHAHLGWVLDRKLTNQARFVPDLLADRDIRTVHRLFGLCTVVTLVAPAVMGGLITWSWWGAVTAFFWAGLVRVTLLHHVTWSVNSICHMIGERPFAARDRSANVWPLAILSMGESWHNLHHADPTCARHGVRPGQIDISARVIWLLEKTGQAYDVRWPTPARLARLSAAGAPH
ncbi:acyl-CoA desaturase [Plantactinospora sp. WMMC1484]|uniref:acyl-CoA desaturase n=1 Tax=Plantactinospora sp. WMMC1484 TaxID=3404122 RepID=UPI003BF5ED2D